MKSKTLKPPMVVISTATMQHVPDRRQGDVPEGLQPARAVERGGLVELARDALQARRGSAPS